MEMIMDVPYNPGNESTARQDATDATIRDLIRRLERAEQDIRDLTRQVDDHNTDITTLKRSLDRHQRIDH